MLSEEIKEAVEKLVQEQMSEYCKRTNATITRLKEENKKLKKLVDELDSGLDHRIKNIISGLPRNFWTKISETDQQETEEADKSLVGSSFEDSWSREKDEPFQTALDFNDTRLQEKNEELLEAKIQQENERKCKIVLELNKEAKDCSNQPMSLDTKILLDQNSEVKDEPKEIVRPKHDSNQPMSLDTRILLDQNSKVKDDQKEIAGSKNDSNQPMSLDTRILLDQTSEVKDDRKEIVDPKNDSTQPMSLDTRILLDQTSVVKDDRKEIVDPQNDSTQPMSLDTRILLDQTSEVKDDRKEIVRPENDSNQPMSLEAAYEACSSKDEHDIKVGGSSKTPVFSEGDLNTKKEFSEERPMPGECGGAKGNIDLQASGMEREKEKTSKRQEGSKTSKLKMAFHPFKKKGSTNH